MLSDCCLSCLSVCLSVWLSCLWRWCTVAKWLDRSTWNFAGRPRPWTYCVTWGPSFPSPKGHSPQFSANICCGQMAGWIKMPLGMEADVGPCDFVLDGHPAFPPSKGSGATSPIFGPFLLWPNGWMHQDVTWYGGRPQPRRPVSYTHLTLPTIYSV